MNFKEIRKVAIELYNQGKDEKEIQKTCKTPINKEQIEKWIQKDEKNKKIITTSKLVKKMKRIKSIEINKNNKDEILKELKTIAYEILKVDENNEMAMNELVRCYSIEGEYEIGRTYGEKLLKANNNNVFVLYNMAKLEMKAGDNKKAKEYNDRLLVVSPDNIHGNIQKTQINKKIKKENKRKNITLKIGTPGEQLITEEIEQIQEDNMFCQENRIKTKTIEEEQREYAMSQMEQDRYSIQEQIEYIEQIQSMFIDGKINSKNIDAIKEELYKYPDKIKSAIFLSDIYFAITEDEQRGIEELDNIINSIQSISKEDYKELDSKINEFRAKIDVREYMNKKENEKKERMKILKQEQREYSRQIIKMIDEGKLSKQDIPEIVSKLEKYPDREKSVFLIMKLYEGFYDKDEALRYLLKYSKITNLTEQEINNITRMRKELTQNTTKTHKFSNRQRRIKLRKRKSREIMKFQKEMNKNLIVSLVQEGKTVSEIYNILMEKNQSVSIKSIIKIRAHVIYQNEDMKSKNTKELKMAEEFLKKGYSVEEVYNLFEANIGKNKLLEMKTQIKEKEGKQVE